VYYVFEWGEGGRKLSYVLYFALAYVGGLRLDGRFYVLIVCSFPGQQTDPAVNAAPWRHCDADWVMPVVGLRSSGVHRGRLCFTVLHVYISLWTTSRTQEDYLHTCNKTAIKRNEI